MIYWILSSLNDHSLNDHSLNNHSLKNNKKIPRSPPLSGCHHSKSELMTTLSDRKSIVKDDPKSIVTNDTTMSNRCPSLRLTEERVHHSPENKATDRGSKPSAADPILSCVRTF